MHKSAGPAQVSEGQTQAHGRGLTLKCGRWGESEALAGWQRWLAAGRLPSDSDIQAGRRLPRNYDEPLQHRLQRSWVATARTGQSALETSEEVAIAISSRYDSS